MEPTDRVVVVTGGASGIGRALAWRLAEEGARGVVVADLDEAGAQAVASDIGPRALGVGCDVADEQQVVDLVSRAEGAFGPVDLFCANAGVAVGTDLETPEETWELAFGVNVRAHVYAAKALLPGWLERGEGYFLATASAAGLLTQIGSAPYALTKHAAVAFAEWLSVTYGDRGLAGMRRLQARLATPR
jgi:NAD(P)-dependent dehydrogenase (short-subunit alcohol dehydrogenase family)